VDYRKEFRIEFTVDRLSLRIMHRAVDIMRSEESYQNVLFPNLTSLSSMRNPDTLDIEYVKLIISLNTTMMLTNLKKYVYLQDNLGAFIPSPCSVIFF